MYCGCKQVLIMQDLEVRENSTEPNGFFITGADDFAELTLYILWSSDGFSDTNGSSDT